MVKCTKLPEIGAECWRCKKNIFAVETPSGADEISCPICGECDVVEDEYEEGKEDYNSEPILEFLYCNKCNIVFEFGYKHANNGCTDDICFGKLVTEYEYQGIKYDGMPIFESVDEYKKICSKMKLTFKELVDVFYCPKASYEE